MDKETKKKTGLLDTSGLLPYNKQPNGFWSIFVTDSNGVKSKRAFFYSLFAFVTLVYMILAMTPWVKLDYEVAGFLFAFLTQQSIAYHKKNRPKFEGNNV